MDSTIQKLNNSFIHCNSTMIQFKKSGIFQIWFETHPPTPIFWNCHIIWSKKYVSHLWAIYFFRKLFRATVSSSTPFHFEHGVSNCIVVLVFQLQNMMLKDTFTIQVVWTKYFMPKKDPQEGLQQITINFKHQIIFPTFFSPEDLRSRDSRNRKLSLFVCLSQKI